MHTPFRETLIGPFLAMVMHQEKDEKKYSFLKSVENLKSAKQTP
jgi:hypothetical protein